MYYHEGNKNLPVPEAGDVVITSGNEAKVVRVKHDQVWVLEQGMDYCIDMERLIWREDATCWFHVTAVTNG